MRKLWAVHYPHAHPAQLGGLCVTTLGHGRSGGNLSSVSLVIGSISIPLEEMFQNNTRGLASSVVIQHGTGATHIIIWGQGRRQENTAEC